ncbi:major facilitator superfamily domain-containing protein [Scheffersomyces xylosifermentans]|uniref:major facilitator superfamily domain-containing protein n=1 Tax=Scheffersomyces xylosifermentans TaxID=1304137 RepID=UPI00315DEDDE
MNQDISNNREEKNSNAVEDAETQVVNESSQSDHDNISKHIEDKVIDEVSGAKANTDVSIVDPMVDLGKEENDIGNLEHNSVEEDGSFEENTTQDGLPSTSLIEDKTKLVNTPDLSVLNNFNATTDVASNASAPSLAHLNNELSKAKLSNPTPTYSITEYQVDQYSKEGKDLEKEKYYESDAGDGTKAIDQHLEGIELWMTLASCFLALFLSALDMTIIVTIYTTVGNKFNSFDKIDWLTSGFLLPMAILTPSYGKISIIFGRKWTLQMGILVFEIGSLICALSSSMNMLIGGRTIQGIGAGCITTTITIIVSESVPINLRSTSLSLMAICYAVASVLGPFIGGAFTEYVTWRWNFFLNVPLGAISFLMIFFAYNPPKPTGRFIDNIKKIDYIGSLLLVAGLVLVLLGITLGGREYSWSSAPIIVCIAIGGVFLVFFFVYNFKFSKHQLFIKEVFTIPQILSSSSGAFFNYAWFMSVLTYLSVYFQVIFGHGSFKSGADLLPFIIATTVSAVVSGILVKVTRFVKLYYVFAAAVGVIGNALLLLFDEKSPVGHRIGFLILLGVSAGIILQCSIISTQIKAPKELTGSLINVTTWNNFMRFLGGAIGVIISTIIFQSCAADNLKNVMEAFPEDLKRQFNGKSSRLFIDSPQLIHQLPQEFQVQMLKGLMKGLTQSFKFALACACACFICSLFVTNKRVPKAEDVLTKKDMDEDIENYALTVDSDDAEEKRGVNIEIESANEEIEESINEDIIEKAGDIEVSVETEDTEIDSDDNKPPKV